MNAPGSLLFATLALATLAVVLGPLVRWWLRRRGRSAVAADLAQLRWPLRLWVVALGVRAGLAFVEGPEGESVAAAAAVATGAWVFLRLTWLAQQAGFRRLHLDVEDNLRARSRRTKLELVRRVVAVIVVTGVVIVTLLTLTPLRSVAPTIVAYAGLIGVVLGLALRAPLENLAAGIVVAFAEPVRIDDVVVVDGEWGRVEEIALVNVTLRLWDERRLVVPTSRLVDEPIENWTRTTSRLTGSVTLWVDFTADLPALRAEVQRIVATTPEWDGRAATVQVVELGEHALQVRVVVTARNAEQLWDLRCEVRERLLAHLVDAPGGVPVVRTEQPELAAAAAGS